MGVRALSATSATLAVGGVWAIAVSVTDADGAPATDAPVVTVTLPAGSTTTPTVETITTGVYRVLLSVATTGRYVGRVVAAGYGAADFVAYVSGTTAGTAMPDFTDYRDWHPDNGGSWSDEQITDSLDTCASAQRAVCRVGAVYPPDLRGALFRRVSDDLASRVAPSLTVLNDGEAEQAIRPGRDPEIARLERPYRKLRFG